MQSLLGCCVFYFCARQARPYGWRSVSYCRGEWTSIYFLKVKFLRRATTANASTATEWHWKTKVPAEVERQVGTTWMRKLTVARYVRSTSAFNSWKCVAVYTAEERGNRRFCRVQKTIENVGGDPTEGGLVLFGLRVHVKNVPLSVILVLRMNSTGTRYREHAKKRAGQ